MNTMKGSLGEVTEGYRQFSNFLSGFALFPAQMEVAKRRHCWIEVLVIQTALIDGLLRMGLILQSQLVGNHEEVDLDLLFQAEGERNLSERQVYAKAIEAKIISESQGVQLEEFYEFRNKAIHRLFISTIKYIDLVPKTQAMDAQIAMFIEMVRCLEEAQLATGRGMTKPSQEGKFEVEEWKLMVLRKLS